MKNQVKRGCRMAMVGGMVAALLVGSAGCAIHQPSIPVSPTPMVTDSQTGSLEPTPPSGSEWAGGAAETWHTSGKKLGFDYMPEVVSPVSESVWVASTSVGDVSQQLVGIDAVSGARLWKLEIAGGCGTVASASGELACLDGNFGRLVLRTYDLVTGKELHKISSKSWGWPAEMVESFVEPVGEDLVVAGSEVLSGDYTGAKVGDMWAARLGPDGTPKWNQRFTRDDTDRSVDLPIGGARIAHGLVYAWNQAIDVETGKSLRGSAGYPLHVDGFASDTALVGFDADGKQSSASFSFPDGTVGSTFDASSLTTGNGRLVEIDGLELPPFIMVQHIEPGQCTAGASAPIQAINPAASPEDLWSKPVDMGVDTASCKDATANVLAAYRDKLVALFDASGGVALVDSATGAVWWHVNLGVTFGKDSSRDLSLLSDGSVLITMDTDDDTRSIILSAADGQQTWQAKGRAEATADGAAIILADSDGGVAKLLPS